MHDMLYARSLYELFSDLDYVLVMKLGNRIDGLHINQRMYVGTELLKLSEINVFDKC